MSIAVTPERQLVMIEQYRHGSNTVELEIPGGMIDPQRRFAGGRRRCANCGRRPGYAGENARSHRRGVSEPGHHEQQLLHGAGGELPVRASRSNWTTVRT